MTLSSQQTRHWRGQAAVQLGAGVFKGRSGDNTEHRHWADQISIALEEELIVSSEGRVYTGKAFFIASNTPHKLAAGLVLSIYLDPFLRFYHKTGAPVKAAEVVLDVSELAPRITAVFDDPYSLQQGLAHFCSEFSSFRQQRASDKLNCILAALQQGVYGGTAMNRAELARLVGLSETRFSHWFKEKTGMPLRSYRKWLRLVHGVEKVLSGNSLIDAAHAADFSDQAYFSRTFKSAFGVTPAVAFNSVLTESKL